jgi:hypothetical protein
VPHGRWQTMSFMAALRHNRITAPWFIEGPIDRVLAPTLRHGDIVIMDNLGSYKAKVYRTRDEANADVCDYIEQRPQTKALDDRLSEPYACHKCFVH